MRDSVLLQEHVRIMLVIPGQGRFPTLRLDDIESCLEKLSNDQLADKPFVFDNEDLHGSTPFHSGVFRVAFLMTLARSGHGFTAPVIWYPLGLTSANAWQRGPLAKACAQ